MTTDIKELKRLAEAATPGPWRWHSDPVKDDPLNRSRYEVVATGRTITRTYYTGDMAEREAAFIAATNPETVLALIAHIEQLEGQLSAAMSGWKQNVEELKTQLSAQTAQAAGLFEKRSMFGPWIEVERPTDKSVPLYTHPAKTEQPSLSDAEILNWLEDNHGFELEKFITWRNGADEYDGVERTYWRFTTSDGDEFTGSTLRESIRAAIANGAPK